MPKRPQAGTIHDKGQVGLPNHPKESQIGDAGDLAHHRDDFVSLGFKGTEVVAKDLDRKLAFDARYGLFHVVRDGLGEAPDDARSLFQFLVHGGDQGLFVLLKDGAPLLLGLQANVVFGVEEAGPIGSIVGTSDLSRRLR